MSIKNDYTSTDERKEWEKKWQVIKELRSAYRITESTDFPLLKKNLTAGNKYPPLIMDGILRKFYREEYFKDLIDKKDFYEIVGINPTLLEKSYKYIGEENNKYSKQYQKNHPEKVEIPKIIIKIDSQNKEISRDKNGRNLTYAFRVVMGRNKRFEYILTLLKKDRLKAKRLNTETTKQNISGEIRNINNLLQKNLNLTKDFIINDGSGYKMNFDVYEIVDFK